MLTHANLGKFLLVVIGVTTKNKKKVYIKERGGGGGWRGAETVGENRRRNTSYSRRTQTTMEANCDKEICNVVLCPLLTVNTTVESTPQRLELHDLTSTHGGINFKVFSVMHA